MQKLWCHIEFLRMEGQEGSVTSSKKKKKETTHEEKLGTK